MTTNAHSHTRKYAPRGVTKTKPVQMRLLPAEREEFERICQSCEGSESHVSRLIYLKGLGVWKAEHAAA
jgi:hypothetical protein